MESRGSSTRFAALATSFAPSRLPIRWRLALGSALLTFVILCGFAGLVGLLTTRQVRSQFDDEGARAANDLAERLNPTFRGTQLEMNVRPSDFARGENAQVRIYYLPTLKLIYATALQPQFSLPLNAAHVDEHGYDVELRRIGAEPDGELLLVYARPLSQLKHTLAKVRFFLILGVLAGAGLALLAGLAIARRAMAPIAELTAAAREVEETRDASRSLPRPKAEDEVAELARTLEEMLHALDSSRAETEATLLLQRQFIADASHELRTPLTSVLANLELLAEELDGESGEAAASALRSSQRMRRLVGNLLLLARADAGRAAPRRPTDLADVLVEAVAELEPVAAGHEIVVAAHPAVVEGSRDELHRLALNLIENAVFHTPAGTEVRVGSAIHDDVARLTVEDDGPGIPPELVPRLFERFVRGGGDSAGGSGLGLSIVRAVARSHGGDVSVSAPAGGGTRFVVELPLSAQPAPAEPAPAPAGSA